MGFVRTVHIFNNSYVLCMQLEIFPAQTWNKHELNMFYAMTLEFTQFNL